MTAIQVPPGTTDDGTLAYDPDTKSVYLNLPNALVIVDTTKKAVATTITATGSPGGITFDQQNLYLASPGQSRIQVIHKGDWSSEPGVDTPSPLSGSIWADPGRGSLFALTQQGEVLVYTAAASPQLSASYNIGASGPGTLVPSTDILYVAVPGQVTALDVTAGKSHSVPLQDPSALTGLAYDDRTGLLWAAAGDHHLIVLDGQSLQARQTLDAPSSSGIHFDGILRFMYSFGAGGFGAYDTNFTLHSAQVDTGDSATSSGAVEPVDHHVYTYEPEHHLLGVYSWGAHGNSYTGPGGGGGTASSSGGSGGGGASGSGGITTTTAPSSSASSAPNGGGPGGAAANASPTSFGAPSSGGTASGVSSTGTGSSSFGSSPTSGSAGTGSGTTGPSSGTSNFGGSSTSNNSSGATSSGGAAAGGTSTGSAGGGGGGSSSGSRSGPASSPSSTASLPAAPVPPSTGSVPTSPKA